MIRAFDVRKTWLGWLTLMQLGVCTANQFDPIPTINSLPIMQGSGLGQPLLTNLNTEQAWSLDLNSYLQSHANDAGSSTEDLIIDAEVHSLSATLKLNFARDWQLGLQISGHKLKAGQLDSLIDDWHDLFGLDDGDRARQARDQLQILYRNQNDTIELNQPQSGLTDALLTLSYQAIDRPTFKLSVHGQLNLPTGSNASLLGSDKLDAAISLSAAGSKGKLGWHANVGALGIGDDNLFLLSTRESTWFSSLGAHWQANDRWRWSAQMDVHGPVFESFIEEINQESWLFSLAGERTIWHNGPRVQLYFSEDVSVNRSADFTLGINIKLH